MEDNINYVDKYVEVIPRQIKFQCNYKIQLQKCIDIIIDCYLYIYRLFLMIPN